MSTHHYNSVPCNTQGRALLFFKVFHGFITVLNVSCIQKYKMSVLQKNIVKNAIYIIDTSQSEIIKNKANNWIYLLYWIE